VDGHTYIGAPVLGNLEEGLSTGTLRVRQRGFVSMTPFVGLCGTEEETSVHILCECEVLASLRHAYLGSFFLDPEDIATGHGGHLELC
jgi:hypothetical protein